MKARLPILAKYLFLFWFGEGTYVLIELAWRGYTHVSMALAGGIGMILLYRIWRQRLPLPIKALFGALTITAIEFSIGVVVNLILHLNVWDYTDLRFHFLGQISLLYSSLWYLMSLCIFLVLPTVDRLVLQRKVFSVEKD